MNLMKKVHLHNNMTGPNMRKAAKLIRDEMTKHNLNQTEVAKKIGKSQPWISRILSWSESQSPKQADHKNLSDMANMPKIKDSPFAGRKKAKT